MAAPAGLAGQIGWKSESVYGTGVVVDKFHPGFLSEGIDTQITRLFSNGIRAGRRTRHQWASGAKTIAGDVTLELWDEPLATLLTHMFGTVNTTGTGPYTHTATPGTLTSKSLTLQVGRPDIGGTVRAFTYTGVKIASWSLACAVDEIPQLTLSVSAQDETTATALASASYPTAAPFTFVHGGLSIAGSAVAVVQSMQLSADNVVPTRHRIGSATTKEQLENGIRPYTGTLTADFEDLTHYARFTGGTEAALVMDFDNGTDSLTITCNVEFDGETPKVQGPEMLNQTLPFTCVGSTDAAAITAVLVNAESSAA